MGGGSKKKQTVGYKIMVDQQLVVCAGPIDGIRRLTWDGKEAWADWSTGDRISINQPALFGGEKREGGVVGDIDFCPGRPDQAPNDYLVAKLGALVNAARGVATLVLRGLYVGMSPYLKRPAVRAQRIHVRGAEGLGQWYDARSAIGQRIPFHTDIEPWALDEDGVPGHSVGQTRYLFKSGVTPAVANASPAEFAGNSGDALQAVLDTYGAGMVYVGYYTDRQPLLDLFGESLTGHLASFGAADGGPRYVYLCFASEAPDQVVYNGLAPDEPSLFCSTLADQSVPQPAYSGVSDAYLFSNVAQSRLAGSDQVGTDVDQFGHGGLLRFFDGSAAVPPEYSVAEFNPVANTCAAAPYGLVGGQFPVARLQPCRVVRAERVAEYYGWGEDPPYTGLWDMNPAHIIREAWTDSRMSMALPESDVDDAALMVAAELFYAEGFGLSMLWSEEQPIGDFVDDICRHADAEWYVDRRSGQLTLKPIRGDYDPADLLVLDRTNVSSIENLTQPLPGELVNSITVQFWDENKVKAGVVTVTNDALVHAQGGLNGKTVKYGGITYRELATRVALRDLRVCSSPLRSCTVKANRQAAGLNKGSVFRLHWPSLGLDFVVMRVADIDFGDGRDNKVVINCVEDVFQMPTTVTVSVASGEGGQHPVQAPAPSPARLVTEAPYLDLVRRLGQSSADSELAGLPEAGYLLVAAQRPSDDALNAALAVDAGAGYEETANIDFSPVAALAADVGRMDTVFQISGGVDLDGGAEGGLAQIGGELLRVDVVDMEAGTVTFGRACLDTVPVPHGAGDKIFFLDFAADGDEVQHAAGDVLDVRVLPETGLGQLDLAEAPADSVTMAERAIRPYPPGNLQFNAGYFPASIAGPLTVSWAHRDRQQQTSGTPADFLAGDIGPEPGVTYTVEIREAGTIVESASGITATTYLSALTGTRDIEVTVYSMRDGLVSWQIHVHALQLIN